MEDAGSRGGSVHEQNSFDWLPKDEGGDGGEEEEDGWGSEFDFDDDDQVGTFCCHRSDSLLLFLCSVHFRA